MCMYECETSRGQTDNLFKKVKDDFWAADGWVPEMSAAYVSEPKQEFGKSRTLNGSVTAASHVQAHASTPESLIEPI